MNEYMAYTLPHATRATLLATLVAAGDNRSPAQVIDLAVKAWLAEAALAQPETAVSATRGYQWKSLFLPEGTLLRAQYRGIYYTAQVRGDVIEYQGRSFSPRRFLMHVTGGVFNAWLALWIRCPGDARWHLADTRRRILRRDCPPVAAAVSAARPMQQASALPAVLPAEIDGLATGEAGNNACTTGSRLTAPAELHPEVHPQLQLEVHPATSTPGQFLDQTAWRGQHYLCRTDFVRDDQPDLSQSLPSGRGYGPHGAGRAGPRDRRLFKTVIVAPFLLASAAPITQLAV